MMRVQTLTQRKEVYRHDDLAYDLAEVIREPASPILLIDSDNNNAGWVSSIYEADEAVANQSHSATAYAVKVRAEYLALDCDSQAASDEIEGALAKLITDAGYYPVIQKSGRDDHKHLFARIGTGEFRMQVEAEIRSFNGSHPASEHIDIRKVIRPPLSPHRLGKPVELVSPASSEEALKWLQPVRVKSTGISKRIRRLIQYGDLERIYLKADGEVDRSRMLQAIVAGAVNAGMNWEWLWIVLTDTRNKGGAKLQEKLLREGQAAAERYLRVCYDKAVDYLNHQKRTTHQEVELIKAHIETLHWDGKQGESERAVLLFLLAWADEHQNLQRINPGELNIQEGAGLGVRRTGRKALLRLCQKGFIKLIKKGNRTQASVYSISIRAVETHNSWGNGGGLSCGITALRNSDLALWSELGKTAMRVYETLIKHPECNTSLSLSKRLHKPTSTIKRALAKLNFRGMIEEQDKHWNIKSLAEHELATLTKRPKRDQLHLLNEQIRQQRKAAQYQYVQVNMADEAANVVYCVDCKSAPVLQAGESCSQCKQRMESIREWLKGFDRINWLKEHPQKGFKR